MVQLASYFSRINGPIISLERTARLIGRHEKIIFIIIIIMTQPPRRHPLGFVCHAFISPPWGRNECVTNEPQRTSAGRLHHDGHPRCFKPMYLNFQQLLLFHKMFEIGEIRCIECKEFCLTLSYPRASRLQRAHCSPFLKLKFAFEHLLFKLKYCLWRLLTKRK